MKIYALALLFTGLMPAYAQLKFIEPAAQTGTSAAVVVDEVPLTHTAQIFPFNKSGEIVGKNNVTVQLEQVFKNAGEILKETNSGFDHIVKLNIHVSAEKYIPEIKRQLALKFAGKTKPAVTYLIYKLWNGADISIDIVGLFAISLGLMLRSERSERLEAWAARAAPSFETRLRRSTG